MQIDSDKLLDALQNHYKVNDPAQNQIMDEVVMIVLRLSHFNSCGKSRKLKDSDDVFRCGYNLGHLDGVRDGKKKSDAIFADVEKQKEMAFSHGYVVGLKDALRDKAQTDRTPTFKTVDDKYHEGHTRGYLVGSLKTIKDMENKVRLLLNEILGEKMEINEEILSGQKEE